MKTVPDTWHIGFNIYNKLINFEGICNCDDKLARCPLEWPMFMTMNYEQRT